MASNRRSDAPSSNGRTPGLRRGNVGPNPAPRTIEPSGPTLLAATPVRIKTPRIGPRSNDHSGQYSELSRRIFQRSRFGLSPQHVGLGPS